MPDEPDPPRKHYGFKPREFDRANTTPAFTPPPPPAAPDPGIVPAAPGQIDVHDLSRIAAAMRPHLSGPRPAVQPNEIHAMMRDNLTHADAAGLNTVAPHARRPSKRQRDYWLLMLVGNGGLLALFAFIIGFNFYSTLFLLGGMCFFTVGVSWIMWQVMDDY